MKHLPSYSKRRTEVSKQSSLKVWGKGPGRALATHQMNGKQRKKQTWPFRETWKQLQEHWLLKQNKTHKKALRKPHSSGKRKWFKGISSPKTKLHSSSDCWGDPEIFFCIEQGYENGQMLATTQQMIVMWGDISGPQPASTQLSHFHGVSN